MFTIGSFRSRTPQICDAAGSNFSQRRLPAHARPFKFDASLSYKTRVKGIWRCVENVSINCPFFKTKWIRMYLLNIKFKTQIHGETFLRKFYATNLAELTFFNLVCRLLRMEKRSEDGLDLQNYLKQVVPPSLISSLF